MGSNSEVRPLDLLHQSRNPQQLSLRSVVAWTALRIRRYSVPKDDVIYRAAEIQHEPGKFS